MLSQFGDESEVLFPPCTMLVVQRRDGKPSHARHAHGDGDIDGDLMSTTVESTMALEDDGTDGSTFGPGAAARVGTSRIADSSRPLPQRVSEASGHDAPASASSETPPSWRSSVWKAEHVVERGRRFVIVGVQPCFV